MVLMKSIVITRTFLRRETTANTLKCGMLEDQGSMRLLQSVNLISYFTSQTVTAQILFVKFSMRIGSNPAGAVEGGNHTASGQRDLKLI